MRFLYFLSRANPLGAIVLTSPSNAPTSAWWTWIKISLLGYGIFQSLKVREYIRASNSSIVGILKGLGTSLITLSVVSWINEYSFAICPSVKSITTNEWTRTLQNCLLCPAYLQSLPKDCAASCTVGAPSSGPAHPPPDVAITRPLNIGSLWLILSQLSKILSQRDG